MKKQSALIFSLLLALGACAPTVANRGNMVDPDVLASIMPGETTREDVASRLGTPTSISTFDDNTWYYIGRQTEQYSFWTPDVTAQQAVAVSFNDAGVVTDVRNLDLSQQVDVSPVDRSTPTYGQKNSVLKDLLGALAHPSPKLTKRRSGQ